MRDFINDLDLNFSRASAVTIPFSALMVVAVIIMLFIQGLNLGIDFKGGTLIEIKTQSPQDLGQMRNTLNNLGYGQVSIQEFGAPEELLIRINAQDDVKQDVIIATVKTALEQQIESDAIDYRRVEFVGPQVGGELIEAGIYAMIFSMLGILVYIWLRFEWQFGIAALLALIHDALLTIGLFLVTQIEFNLATVAAVLMIAGYSINDTVVVFDRVRENLRKYKKKLLPDLFNMSITQTLSRTILTSGTTLLALIALYVFGGEVIRGFIIALIWGIIVGTYSSIFLATPLLKFFNLKRTTLEEEAQKA